MPVPVPPQVGGPFSPPTRCPQEAPPSLWRPPAAGSVAPRTSTALVAQTTPSPRTAAEPRETLPPPPRSWLASGGEMLSVRSWNATQQAPTACPGRPWVLRKGGGHHSGFLRGPAVRAGGPGAPAWQAGGGSRASPPKSPAELAAGFSRAAEKAPRARPRNWSEARCYSQGDSSPSCRHRLIQAPQKQPAARGARTETQAAAAAAAAWGNVVSQRQAGDWASAGKLQAGRTDSAAFSELHQPEAGAKPVGWRRRSCHEPQTGITGAEVAPINMRGAAGLPRTPLRSPSHWTAGRPKSRVLTRCKPPSRRLENPLPLFSPNIQGGKEVETELPTT